MSVDLSRTTVVLDFDGTISTRDVGVVLLDAHGDPDWRELEAMYAAGEIGSRECMIAQLDCLPGDEALLRSTAATVPLDPGAAALVAGLRDAGAEVLVASDGFGFYVDDLLAAAGIAVPVLTNAVDWATGEMQFPHLDACCACSSCGTCKQAPLRAAKARGRTTVFVGDGPSDRKAALLADVLFAKDRLAAWCAELDVPHTRFTCLAEVHAALLGTP